MSDIKKAISDLAQATGVISAPVDEVDELVMGDLYYVELLREIQHRLTSVKKYRYRIKCESGREVTIEANSITEAMRYLPRETWVVVSLVRETP